MTEPVGRPPITLPVAVVIALPGAYLGASTYVGLPAPATPAVLQALIYGIAIVGAAFILSWAAEAAQVDIDAGLALALLALLAVLPEYAVDFVFTWECGAVYAEGPPGLTGGSNVCSLALANMTGANRVLVGVGWPLVVLVATLAVWRAGRDPVRPSLPQDRPGGEGRDRHPVRGAVRGTGRPYLTRCGRRGRGASASRRDKE